MKRVQECFREADISELIQTYIHKYPLTLSEITDHNVTVAQVKEAQYNLLADYIKRLCSLEIKSSSDGKKHVLFVHKVFCERDVEETSSLVCLEELQVKGVKAQCYAYNDEAQEIIMGYYVADTPFTREHLTDLLVDVMYEASWHGFHQERLEGARKNLETTVADFKLGKTKAYTYQEVFGDLEERKECDDTEEVLVDALTSAVNQYNQYFLRKEMLALMDAFCVEKATAGAEIARYWDAVRNERIRSNMPEMTLEEINAEIATYRAEKNRSLSR